MSTEYAEEDAFFCFANLIAEIEQCFSREFDHAMMDTQNPVGRYQALLALLDRELFVDLARKNIDARFYVLRWLSLLFTQELELPDVLRLWDSLLGDPHRFRFLLFFACAMVMSVREQILANEFGPCLMLLQNMPVGDVCQLIARATQLMESTDPACLEPQYLAAVYADAMAAAQRTRMHTHTQHRLHQQAAPSCPSWVSSARAATPRSMHKHRRRRAESESFLPSFSMK